MERMACVIHEYEGIQTSDNLHVVTAEALYGDENEFVCGLLMLGERPSFSGNLPKIGCCPQNMNMINECKNRKFLSAEDMRNQYRLCVHFNWKCIGGRSRLRIIVVLFLGTQRPAHDIRNNKRTFWLRRNVGTHGWFIYSAMQLLISYLYN